LEVDRGDFQEVASARGGWRTNQPDRV